MEVTFACILHDDVYIPFICEELMQFYDILMVDSPEDLYLRTRLFRIPALNKMYAYLDRSYMYLFHGTHLLSFDILHPVTNTRGASSYL